MFRHIINKLRTNTRSTGLRSTCLLAPALCGVSFASWSACESREPSYYGSYGRDRFGGGIGERVGVDEGRKQPIAGTGVSRIAVLSDTHENLARWASADNWKAATQIHKAAYFTRTENLVQEEVLQRVREHYTSAVGYVSKAPIQAALFRLEDADLLKEKFALSQVTELPRVVRGVFDEKTEPCIVDFANKRLGGAWLSYGMVQEEKLFIERFDYGALCARSLVEMDDPTSAPLASPFSMHPNEAWVLRGGVRFAEIGWYGRTPKDALQKFKLVDPREDQETCPTIIAIDAIKADFETYDKAHIEMMIRKAYIGFVAASSDPDLGKERSIATGSWGCGAFYNNECVMFVVQTLAANMANVQLTYHVLGDGKRLAPAFAFLEDVLLTKVSVSEAIDKLAELCSSDLNWKTKFRPRL